MAAGATYTPIATYTISGSAAAIAFTSIPSTYTDLIIVFNGGSSRASTSDTFIVRLNSDSGTNYSTTFMRGNGSTASTNRTTSDASLLGDGIRIVGTTYGLNSMVKVNINNYANTATYKNAIATSAAADEWGAAEAAGVWRNTSAINRIDLSSGTTSAFAVGSTATLYGITAA